MIFIFFFSSWTPEKKTQKNERKKNRILIRFYSVVLESNHFGLCCVYSFHFLKEIRPSDSGSRIVKRQTHTYSIEGEQKKKYIIDRSAALFRFF